MDWVNVRIPKKTFEAFEPIAADKHTSTNQQIVAALNSHLYGFHLGYMPEVSRQD